MVAVYTSQSRFSYRNAKKALRTKADPKASFNCPGCVGTYMEIWCHHLASLPGKRDQQRDRLA